MYLPKFVEERVEGIENGFRDLLYLAREELYKGDCDAANAHVRKMMYLLGELDMLFALCVWFSDYVRPGFAEYVAARRSDLTKDLDALISEAGGYGFCV